MKNVEVLYTPEEITSRVTGMWQTDLFKREAANPNSFISKVVAHAAQYPLFMYDMSDLPNADTPDNEKLEWPHFTAWMGGVPRRHYANPAIQDLAMLHELYHKGFMTYSKDMSFEAFKRKIWDNELEASVTTELEVYFRHPEFRDATFDQEILADRFLRDEKFMQRWNNDPERMRAAIREKRRDAMHREDKSDSVAYWIHRFATQNEAWALSWHRRYNQVEHHMAELQERIDAGGDRKQLMDEYMGWLQSPEVTQGGEVPFPDEAKAFHASYMLHKQDYNTAVDMGDMPRGSITSYIEQHHPGMDVAAALAGPIAAEVKGELPGFSNRTNYQISNVTGLMPGSFAIAHGIDPTVRGEDGRMGEIMVVLQERGDKGPNGEPRYGALGGYTNVDNNPEKNVTREQPDEGCARELHEELVDDKGNPIWSIDPSRLKLKNVIAAGHDYRRADTKDEATTYLGYALELTPKELAAAKTHAKRMTNDPVYAAAAKKASEDEVAKVLVIPLREALAMERDSFTHPHEYDAIHELKARLQEREQLRSNVVQAG